MARFQRFIGVATLSCALAACATVVSPVDVTRFHDAAKEPITPGTVKITSVIDTDTNGLLEQRTYEAAVLRELQNAGFTEARTNPDGSEYIVRVSFDQAQLTAGGRRSPVSVGVGGSTGSYGSGVGLGIGINLGGRPKNKIATELSVRITRRSNDDVIWEGRSSVEAKEGSPAAQPGLSASKLAEALFRDFPGQSGETIRVP